MANLLLHTFTTNNVVLATYLKCSGNRIVNIQPSKQSSWKADFEFENVDRDLITNFNNDAGLIEPKMFAQMMHNLIQSGKRVRINE